MATAPDSTTKKSLPSSPAANRTSPASTVRRRPRLRSRARWSSSRRGKAPLRSTASATPPPMRWSSLLVALHRVSRACAGVIGIEPELLPGTALAQKVPVAVELDLHLAQTFPVALEGLGVGAVLLLALSELLLLGHEALDPRGNALVAHGLILVLEVKARDVGPLRGDQGPGGRRPRRPLPQSATDGDRLALP